MNWALLLLLLALPAAARDLYLWPSSFFVSPGERITVWFNQGDVVPSSTDALNLNLLRDYSLVTKYAEYNITGLHLEPKAISGQARIPRKGEMLLTARTNPSISGNERTQEFAKAILFSKDAGGQFHRVIGFALEIVPDADPYALHAGEELPVRVVWRGKPAPGLTVDATHTTGAPAQPVIAGQTDPEGRISIRITAPGGWRLRTNAEAPISGPASDGGATQDLFRTSLTFAVR
ncbi:MAG: DUF4198 domain-containing protein [Bryobacteraceae bacterium]